MNLKKFLISIFSAGLFLNSTASAESPFADAPQWSYQPISELIDAKIIDGADARNFSKDEVMTRYDMARLVGRAVYKIERANPDQKILIEKLAAEFSEELNYFKTPLKIQPSEDQKDQIDQISGDQDEKSKDDSDKIKSIKVDPIRRDDGLTPEEFEEISGKLRKGGKIPPFEIAAYARQRYEYVQNPPNTAQNQAIFGVDTLSHTDQMFRYYIYFLSRLPNDYRFAVRYGHDETTANDRSGLNHAYLHWAALIGDVGHGTRMKLGRQDLMLGYGMAVSTGMAWDGLSFNIHRGVSNYRFGAFQRSDNKKRRYWFASYEAKINPQLEFKGVYFKDSKSRIDNSTIYGKESIYDLWTIGAQYKFKNQPFTLTAEYGHNDKNAIYDSSNGYYAQLNYRTADLKHPRSWTTWIQYRNADLGFNQLGFSALDQPSRMTYDASRKLTIDDVQGFEYGFTYVPIENTMATLKFWDLRRDGGTKQQGGILQFEYLWR